METLHKDLTRYADSGWVHHPLVIGSFTAATEFIEIRKTRVRRQELMATGKNMSSSMSGLTVSTQCSRHQ
jgi:hypothetical protein